MITTLLWDIDGTLLDFQKAERYAIRKCFSLFELGECTDDMLRRYAVINRKYWEALERGELEKDYILVERFREFFGKENIKFKDCKAFNEEYQIRLADHAFFNDYGKEIVKFFQGKLKQYAVTNGTFKAQTRKFRISGLDKLLDGAFISDEIGFEKPSIQYFDSIQKKIGRFKKEEVMIIGDSLTSDMKGGNNAGILCCWFNPGHKERNQDVRIDYEINSLKEVRSIFAE